MGRTRGGGRPGSKGVVGHLSVPCCWEGRWGGAEVGDFMVPCKAFMRQLSQANWPCFYLCQLTHVLHHVSHACQAF